MSVSTKRLQFLDKENKVLVKDFTKEVTGNAIYTNFVAPILTELGLGSLLEGAQALDSLVNNYSQLYERLSSPTEAAKMVETMLVGLDLADPRLADVAGMLSFLKNDLTGAKEQFLTEVLSQTSDSFINNPSLVTKYSAVSSNVQTQMLLSALANSGSTVKRTDFNTAAISTGQSSATQTTKPSTDNNTGNPFLDNPVVSETPTDTPQPTDTSSVLTIPASTTISEADKLKLTIQQYNEVVAGRVKKPDYQNPLLKPLEDSSSSTYATDEEFAKIAKFFMIYAMFKIASYRACVFNLYSSEMFYSDISDINVPVAQISGPLVEYCVNVVTDTTYGARKLINVFGICCTLIVEYMKETVPSEAVVNQLYDRYTQTVESVIALGLKDSPEYQAVDKFYYETLFAAEDSMVKELSLDLVDRIKGANVIELMRFGSVFTSVLDSIVSSQPVELVALNDSNSANFVGVHASTYLLFKIASSVSTIKPSTEFTYQEKAWQLRLVSIASQRTTGFSANPLTSDPTKDFLDKLPYFLKSFKLSTTFKKVPTSVQLTPYEGFDFLGMWKLLQAKSKRINTTGEYDAIINSTPEQLLAEYDGSSINETLLKAYNLFEQEADYAGLDDLNIVHKLSTYIDRENGVRPVAWVGADPESFTF